MENLYIVTKSSSVIFFIAILQILTASSKVSKIWGKNLLYCCYVFRNLIIIHFIVVLAILELVVKREISLIIVSNDFPLVTQLFRNLYFEGQTPIKGNFFYQTIKNFAWNISIFKSLKSSGQKNTRNRNVYIVSLGFIQNCWPQHTTEL